MDKTRERQVAIDAVISAGKLCRKVAESLISSDSIEKDDRSPVTVADFGAQAIVAMALEAAYPDDKLVGEEDADALRKDRELCGKVVKHVRETLGDKTLSEEQILNAIDRGNHTGGATGRFWVLDPIDGTKGFLRRAQYAVALGLVEDGQVVLGVLGCPNLGEELSSGSASVGTVFAAVRGQGATMRREDAKDDQPISVSDVKDPAAIVRTESVESSHSKQDVTAVVANTLGIEAEPCRLDSQAKYGVVSRGEATVYMRLPTRKDYQEKIWDHAAGAIIVEEAGGKVTDIDGKPLDFGLGQTLAENRGIVATNGHVHSLILEAIKNAS